MSPTQTPAMLAVYASLREGFDTGDKIRCNTGLPHESVYQALVSLEAKGSASLVVTRPNRGTNIALWSAL